MKAQRGSVQEFSGLVHESPQVALVLVLFLPGMLMNVEHSRNDAPVLCHLCLETDGKESETLTEHTGGSPGQRRCGLARERLERARHGALLFRQLANKR